MPTRLPLFPLGLVLVPGMVLPLHVFEQRYRALVRDLQALPEQDRRFGVVAIRSGREVGEDGVLALHDVGCIARVQHLQVRPDGRSDVLTVGHERFRLTGVAHDEPYLVGLVEPLPEQSGDAERGLLATSVRTALEAYFTALALAGSAGAVELPDLPADARTLSYLVAAGTRLDLDDRQSLLEVPDDAGRLRSGLALLRRELRLMSRLSAVPAPELARAPLSLN